MESVVRFTLRQQVLFNLIFVLLMLVGLFAISDLPVERYPHINFGRVIITTIYPGASPRDVETLVTIELEQAIEGLRRGRVHPRHLGARALDHHGQVP